MATNENLSSFMRQVSISYFKAVVDLNPLVASYIKNSINFVHQHTIREHTNSHTFKGQKVNISVSQS